MPRTSSAASQSPLASPATTMKLFGFNIFPEGSRHPSDHVRGSDPGALRNDLVRNFESEVKRPFGRFATNDRRSVGADAFYEMLEFEFQWLLLLNRHRLAHDAFAAELAHNRRIFGVEQF